MWVATLRDTAASDAALLLLNRVYAFLLLLLLHPSSPVSFVQFKVLFSVCFLSLSLSLTISFVSVEIRSITHLAELSVCCFFIHSLVISGFTKEEKKTINFDGLLSKSLILTIAATNACSIKSVVSYLKRCFHTIRTETHTHTNELIRRGFH